MVTFAETVAASNATADIAFVVCVVSFLIAGGVAIYLLWDKVNQSKGRSGAKPRIVRPKVAKSTVKKTAGPKRTAKKAVAKKPAARKTVKKKK